MTTIVFLCHYSYRRPKPKMREYVELGKMTFAIRRVVFQGSRFINFVWEIHFGSQNAEMKLLMWSE